MICQNPGCRNDILDVKGRYQKITCSRKCQYELRTYNSQNTCMEKYGVKSATGLKQTNNVRKETLLNKYGSETYNNRDKAKETLNEKFGVDNVSQLQSVKNKKKETCFRHYGVDNPTRFLYS